MSGWLNNGGSCPSSLRPTCSSLARHHGVHKCGSSLVWWKHYLPLANAFRRKHYLPLASHTWRPLGGSVHRRSYNHRRNYYRWWRLHKHGSRSRGASGYHWPWWRPILATKITGTVSVVTSSTKVTITLFPSFAIRGLVQVRFDGVHPRRHDASHIGGKGTGRGEILLPPHLKLPQIHELSSLSNL